MKIIDMRSDTVTKPTQEMRAAMAVAEVGDDVFGEDPTVNRLQELAAERMGKDSGLFVTSGTMGNLIATLCACQRGDEVLMGELGHTFLFEGGGISALGGVFPHTLRNQADGTLLITDIEGAIRPNDVHHPRSRMLILENTHNRCGGVVLSKVYTEEAAEIGHKHGLHVHMDGARIFNAAAELGIAPIDLVSRVDSVTFCLSKGLCAPVGSVLCGSKEFIDQARRVRKMLGGGMRQAGVLAAAGIIAIEKMSTRLTEDHKRAKRIAEGLSLIPGVRFDMGFPPTNMVFPSIDDTVKLTTREVIQKLADRGIKIGVTGERKFRIVTHYWIDDQDVEVTLQAMKEILSR